MTKWTAVLFVILFAAGGVACGVVNLRDHVTVQPTESPSVMVADEPLTITEAKREVEIVVLNTKKWVEWREQDIAKREQLVAFVEGFASSGLDIFGETAGAWAGPFAPLAALALGYFTKRRGDATPDQLRKEKEDSYNAGMEFAKAFAKALNERGKDEQPNKAGT